MPDIERVKEAAQLRAAAKGLNLALDAQQIEHVSQYLDLLAKWNKVYNLTAIKDRQQMVVRHAIDSLSVAALMKGSALLDVGTGAGLPGIPLAIALPDLQVTLLDVIAKRTRFLNQVVAQLQLSNVQVVTSRVEDYVSENGFDLITTRAYASLSDMLTTSQHLLTQDGRYIAMKGDPEKEELGKVPEGWQTQLKKLDYEGRTGARHAVILSRLSS